jgi:hypothetical protein
MKGLSLKLAPGPSVEVALFYEGAFYFGDTYGAGRAPYWPIYIVAILLSLGILACLKFMWDVRHPKIE